MPQSKQKKFKFSKGEINEKLLERQDIAILDSSASFIKNMVSSPYGSVRVRGGTKRIDKIATNKLALVPTVTNFIGGTTSYITDFNNIFFSAATGGTNELIRFDYGSSINIYKSFLENAYFQIRQPILEVFITAGVITSVIIIDGGIGMNNLTLEVLDPRGSGAVITAIVNTAGTVTSTVITNGGTNYTSSAHFAFTYDDILVQVKVQGSQNAIVWTNLGDHALTDTEQDFITTINDSYRYLRLYAPTLVNSRLVLYNWTAYDNPVSTTAKLEAFVFNNQQKYVLVLKNESIDIYDDDVLSATVVATGLLDIYFRTLKTAQAEDTMVFTHPEMPVKQLQRSFASEPYTNDPTIGFNIVLTMVNTVAFQVGDEVIVSSSAGSELAIVTAVNPNVSITVDELTLNHTTTNPLVTSKVQIQWAFSDFPLEDIPFVLFESEVISFPAFTLTPDAEEGTVKMTASGAAFTAASLGQIIDGGGGRLRITEFLSSTEVQGFTIIPFYDTSVIASGDWQYITGYEIAWSDTRGWPTTCMFNDQRLWFGGSKGKPNTVWASRVGQFNTFENVGNYANDGIAATISSEQVDEIVNIYPNRGIQLFTAGAEWIIPEGSTTPDTITFIKSTSNGSIDTIKPVDIAGTTLFVEKNGKSLLGFVFNNDQGNYISSSFSLLTSLIEDPIGIAVDYNSSKDVGNFIYMPKEDGTMVVICILLDQDINSPVRFVTDGLFIDITNLVSDTYVLVDRKDVIYLEKLEFERTDNTIEDSSLSDVITGLSDYNGYYVRVFNDETNFGSYFVKGGQITLTSVPTAPIFIGLDFDYELISTKIAINGQTENIEKRIAKATITTADTPRLTFCGQTLEKADDRYDFYGVTGYGRDCRFNITGTFDYVEVLSLLLNLNFGDK